MIDSLLTLDIFTPIDRHFAEFMLRLDGSRDSLLFLAASLLSNASNQGHICLELASFAGKPIVDNGDIKLVCPTMPEWLSSLRFKKVVGRPGDFTPLILDSTRLYLHRYWYYEQSLIDNLLRRISRPEEILDAATVEEGLNRLFPHNTTDLGPNWQKAAAFVALNKGFCTISGGPGTGKTTTVVKILALMLEQLGLRTSIALTAPTGKAATRLQEAVLKAKTWFNCHETVKSAIPEQVSTIHRLLGASSDPSSYRYNEENPLPFQVVVVDEASMVDLSLMARLFQALPESARIILLGDKDQLASVQPGAVLGDICGIQEKTNIFSPHFGKKLAKITGISNANISQENKVKPIQDCLVSLEKNYRFGSDSGIATVSRFIKKGNSRAALEGLKNGRFSDTRWAELPSPKELEHALKTHVINGFSKYLETDNYGEIFGLFDTFRILCAIRNGPYGVDYMNTMVRRILSEAGLVKQEGQWYRGRPIMITRNDYNLRLFNGDIGITNVDREDSYSLRVFFRGTEGTVRKFLPQMLPQHETAYAMTVHKSQGSEFDKVLLVLPDRQVEVLSRELIYTGITRAKREVTVKATEPVFHAAVNRRIERNSGLQEALWN